VGFSFIPFSADAFSSTGADELRLIYDSNVLIDAARPFGGIATTLSNQLFDDPQIFFGPEDPIEFVKDVEYTLSLSVSGRTVDIGVGGLLEIYLVGPAFPTSNPLGQLITSYELDSDTLYKPFGKLEWNFTAPHDGLAYLRFVVYGGQWHTNDISIKPASERGFTPDEVEFVVPVNGHKNELLKFNIQLFDGNNILVPITLETEPTPFDGGNFVIKGDKNRIDGELVVAPSGSEGAVITSRGFRNRTGTFIPGSTAIYIGSGQHGNVNTPFLVASGSVGPVFSLGDRVIAENSGSEYVVTISGTLLVQNRSTSRFEDVRDVVSGSSNLSALYAIETATNSLVSSSLYLNYSGSIFSASIAAVSTSLAQSSQSAQIVNDVNQIILPTSIKVASGLYLESASIGFYNAAQSQYPVVINSLGQFRFADSSSYVGGSDPYTRVVGFANGSFLVRTDKLMLETPNLQLIGNNTASAAINSLKMGNGASGITLTNKRGFYADGDGNFRVGTDSTGSNYIMFDSNNALFISSSNFFLNAGSGANRLQLNPFQLILGNSISPGTWPFPYNSSTFKGLYADNAGQIFVGDATQNFVQFGGQVVEIRANAFVLKTPGFQFSSSFSGSGGDLRAGSATSLTAGTGGWLGGDGTFRAGNPLGSQIKWDGSTLTVSGTINIVGGNAATQTYAISTAANGFTSASAADAVVSASAAVGDSNVSASAAAANPINPIGGIKTAVTPSGNGLYLGSTYLGYYVGGVWTSYIDNNGNFQFKGDNSNLISWDGATLGVKATTFDLNTTGLRITNTTSTASVQTGTGGTGSYFDALGNFQVSNAVGTFTINRFPISLGFGGLDTIVSIDSPTGALRINDSVYSGDVIDAKSNETNPPGDPYGNNAARMIIAASGGFLDTSKLTYGRISIATAQGVAHGPFESPFTQSIAIWSFVGSGSLLPPSNGLGTIGDPNFRLNTIWVRNLSGSGVYADAYYTTSTRAAKKNISQFTGSALDIIKDVNIVSFNYKNDEKQSAKIGFIAEDTNELLTGQDKSAHDHANSIGLLLKAVQELQSEVERLKKNAH
jgi:hypothetical protein